MQSYVNHMVFWYSQCCGNRRRTPGRDKWNSAEGATCATLCKEHCNVMLYLVILVKHFKAVHDEISLYINIYIYQGRAVRSVGSEAPPTPLPLTSASGTSGPLRSFLTQCQVRMRHGWRGSDDAASVIGSPWPS